MRFARSPGRSRLTLIVFLGCLCFQMQGVAHAKLRGRAIGGRRIAGRGIGPRAADRVGIGRRLLRIEPPASDEACVTAYENIARRPELSELKSVVDTLPRIREKLEDPTRVFTLFTPTNDAIRRLREWEDWESAKKDLVECLYEGNRSKSESAPVIAIVGYDQAFPSALPRLFPHKADAQSYYEGKPDLVESTALRNSSLHGAYLLMAARALGLDCGPMSGFDAPAVDRAFWTGTSVRTNFLCNIGFGNHSLIKPRGPRLAFDEVCSIL